MAAAFAHYIAAIIAKLTSAPGADTLAEPLPPAQTVLVYGDVFMHIAYVAAGAGILLLLISPLLHRWAHEHPNSAGEIRQSS